MAAYSRRPSASYEEKRVLGHRRRTTWKESYRSLPEVWQQGPHGARLQEKGPFKITHSYEQAKVNPKDSQDSSCTTSWGHLIIRGRGKRIALAKSRTLGPLQQVPKSVRSKRSLLYQLAATKPMSIHTVINATFLATAMINNGCCTYCLVNEKSVQKINLLRIPITPITIEGVNN